jgi:hypothetical protein
MATATKRTMVINGDNTGNGYGKDGGGSLTAATMLMGMGTAQRTWLLALRLERGGLQGPDHQKPQHKTKPHVFSGSSPQSPGTCKLGSVPLNECGVDLIGPWTIQVCNKSYKFNTLTVIDTVFNLVELVRIDEKTLAHVARKYTQVWLSRYPWPEQCVRDNGGEFVGPEFQFLLQGCRIKDAPTLSKNPQAYAICEWMHQTVGNVLRTLLNGEPPQDVTRAKDFID